MTLLLLQRRRDSRRPELCEIYDTLQHCQMFEFTEQHVVNVIAGGVQNCSRNFVVLSLNRALEFLSKRFFVVKKWENRSEV